MPLFDFKCERCGERFERLVRGSSVAGLTCPGCGAPDPKKQISVFATVGMSRSQESADCAPGGT